eukprot:8608927-Lingulodinium_polyedra.AAC.1
MEPAGLGSAGQVLGVQGIGRGALARHRGRGGPRLVGGPARRAAGHREVRGLCGWQLHASRWPPKR